MAHARISIESLGPNGVDVYIVRNEQKLFGWQTAGTSTEVRTLAPKEMAVLEVHDFQSIKVKAHNETSS